MLAKRFIDELQQSLGFEGAVNSLIPVGGGSINRAYSFSTERGKFFLKVNDAERFPGMFACEARGLELLAAHGGLAVPRVIKTGNIGKEQFLVLDFLERKNEDDHYFHALGKGLAMLHRITQKDFGLDHANFIGSLPQDNTPESTWSEFFICRRIEPLLKQSIDMGELPKSARVNFANFFKRIDELLPKEAPALLHGDLWSENKMNATSGPAIFDPAAYFGHREADIAMTKLFGGFTTDFYIGYTNEFPIEKGWEARIDLFNLYPLLVHTVLFGGSYASDVMNIIRKF